MYSIVEWKEENHSLTSHHKARHMITVTLEKLEISISLKGFSIAESLTLSELAALEIVPGADGSPASLATLRRYADPKKGIKIFGCEKAGLILPTVLAEGVRRTMPAWVRKFVESIQKLS